VSRQPLFPTLPGRDRFHAAFHACLARWPLPQEGRWVETAAGRTHVVVSGPAGAPAAVLLHGAGLTVAQWAPQVEALAAHHRVYAVEAPGDFGRSAEARAPGTRAEATAWLAETLAGLGLGGGAGVVLVGHGAGAALALAYAAGRPEGAPAVRALVLLSPVGGLRPMARPFELGVLLPLSLLPTAGLVGRAVRALLAPGGGVDPFSERLLRVCLQHGRPGARAHPEVLSDAELRDVVAPVLLLVGEGDRVVPPGPAVRRARTLLPRVETHAVPGAGHLLGLEQAAAVNAHLQAFLAGLELRPALRLVARSA
jgi:pimeloyl-ACP methyl ester carboxylesterase